jgi:hypothetical protein
MLLESGVINQHKAPSKPVCGNTARGKPESFRLRIKIPLLKTDAMPSNLPAYASCSEAHERERGDRNCYRRDRLGLFRRNSGKTGRGSPHHA